MFMTPLGFGISLHAVFIKGYDNYVDDHEVWQSQQSITERGNSSMSGKVWGIPTPLSEILAGL